MSARTEATVLPSIPPSPSLLDEVFGQRSWSVRLEESDLQGSRRFSSKSAGSLEKGKERQTPDEEGGGEDEHDASVREAYPPMTDAAAETRRVEETLKRWELAERQRRKSVRESAQQTSGPSLLTSVTRTASLVLSRRSRAGSVGVGPNGTRAFKSQDTVDVSREGYAVPLDDIDHRAHVLSGRDVAVHSPSASLDTGTPGTATVIGSGSSRTSENPFVHPSERTRMVRPSTPPSPTPFSDAHGREDGSTDLMMRVGTRSSVHMRTRSSGSATSVPPPPPPKPRPLGLPSPPQDTPHAAPLQPTPQPVLRPARREDPKERQEDRWWHDWLCGCSEGPDRGGDSQAGRTNPFE